jgi:hypothetical protein
MTDIESRVDYDRLSVMAGILLLVMALTRFLELPARPLMRTTILGSSLGIDLSVANLMRLIILGLSITAISSIVSNHPLKQRGQLEHRYMYWIVPSLLTLALATWQNRIVSLEGWIAALLTSAILIPVAMTVEYHAVDPAVRARRPHRWQQLALIHLTAVILFTLIYDARIRSLLSATAVLIAASLLATRLFWMHQIGLGRAFKYGGVAGLVLGQMTWGLNYWRLSGLQGGLFLLLVFYVVVGLVLQYLQGQFDDDRHGRRVLLEYGAVAIVILSLIVLANP